MKRIIKNEKLAATEKDVPTQIWKALKSNSLSDMEILIKRIALVIENNNNAGLKLMQDLMPRDSELRKLIDQQESISSRLMKKLKRFEKFVPEEAFITAGLNEIDNLYYAAIVTRNPNAEKNGQSDFIILLEKRQGFLASVSAKEDTAYEFPLIPVLKDKLIPEAPDEFIYPAYTKAMEIKSRVIIQADERRERRAKKK